MHLCSLTRFVWLVSFCTPLLFSVLLSFCLTLILRNMPLYYSVCAVLLLLVCLVLLFLCCPVVLVSSCLLWRRGLAVSVGLVLLAVSVRVSVFPMLPALPCCASCLCPSCLPCPACSLFCALVQLTLLCASASLGVSGCSCDGSVALLSCWECGLVLLSPMQLSRLWTDAPVARESEGEQQSRGSRGSTQGPTKAQEQRRGGSGKTTKETTGHRDRAATKGGGAGKAEEDRAEKAAHITLEQQQCSLAESEM